MRVAVVQMNSAEDKAHNLSTAERLLTEAAARGAELAVLPELFTYLGRRGKHREVADATLGMIGGQYRDITGDTADLDELHRLKTGRLFVAAVGIGLDVAGVPDDERAPWIAFGEDVGLLFQVVDDLLDGDGYVERIGPEATRSLADEVAERASTRLDELGAETSVLLDLLDALTFRTG